MTVRDRGEQSQSRHAATIHFLCVKLLEDVHDKQ